MGNSKETIAKNEVSRIYNSFINMGVDAETAKKCTRFFFLEQSDTSLIKNEYKSLLKDYYEQANIEIEKL